MGLDENDVNILNVLQENGRLSFRQISERVKVSVPTVSSKIGNLERMGVIKGYRAEVDPERLGELSAIVTIKARPSELAEVAGSFRTDDRVRQMFFLSSGRLLLVCTFINAHAINEFASKLASIPQVLEYDIANVIGVVKELERAVISSEVNPVVICWSCGKEIRDEPLRTKEGGEYLFVCSTACLNALHSASGRKEL